jgi:hypothetical protein
MADSLVVPATTPRCNLSSTLHVYVCVRVYIYILLGSSLLFNIFLLFFFFFFFESESVPLSLLLFYLFVKITPKREEAMSGGRNAVSEFLVMMCFVFVFSSFGGLFNEGGGGEGDREERPAAAAAAVSIMVAIQAAFVRQSCYARLTVAYSSSLQFHF